MHGEQMTKNYLLSLGFEDSEIKAFLTVVEYGALTMTDLSKKSGVERTSLYRMLDDLAAKGLVVLREERKRKLVYPADASTLKAIINEQEVRLERISKNKHEFLTQLKQISGQSTTMKIEFYNGTESLKQLQWDMIKKRKNTLYSVMNATFTEMFEMDFFTEWQKHSVKAKIAYSDPFISSLKKSGMNKLQNDLTDVEFYYVRPEKYKTVQFFETYDDKVIYYNWASIEPSAVLIRNQVTADSTNQLIELVIESAGPSQTWSEVQRLANKTT